MYTYKFRLIFDEIEDFVRDYEILADQTFKDFHDIIVESISGLEGNELASFYICDRKWEKKTEITLIEMDSDKNKDYMEEDNIPKVIMSESVLSDFIDDPHQRLIYEYDFLNIKTFYIELLKTSEVTKAASKKKYPLCSNAFGEMPKSIHLSHDNMNISDIDADSLNEEETEDYYDEEDIRSLNDDIEI
jgi:hypothetical protein